MFKARLISRNRKRPGLRPGSLHPPPARASAVPAIQVKHCQYLNCDNSFPTVARLMRHYRTHTKTFPYACKCCPYKSCFESNVIKHIRTVHFHLPATLCEQKAKGIVDKRDPRVHLTVDEGQLQLEQQLLKCVFKFPFRTRDRSRRNANQAGSSVSPNSDSDTEEVTDNEDENDTADCEPEFLYAVAQPKRHFVCRFNDCGKEYSAMSKLFDHTRTHTEYRPFSCAVVKGTQLCGYESAKKSNVRTHIRTHHWNLPRTNLEQQKKGIVDDRNPDEFIQCNESLLEKERQLLLKQMTFNLWIVKEEDQATFSEGEEEEEEEIYENEESVESESESESDVEPHSRQYQRRADALCEGEIQEETAPKSQLKATTSGKRACPNAQGGKLIPSSSHLRTKLVKKSKVGNCLTVSDEQPASEGWVNLKFLDTQTVQARREESQLTEEEVMEEEDDDLDAEKGDAHSEEANLEEGNALPNTEEDGQFAWRNVELPYNGTDCQSPFFDDEEHGNSVPIVGDDAGTTDCQSGDAESEQKTETVERGNAEGSQDLPQNERNCDIIDLTSLSSDTDTSSAYSSDSSGDETAKPFSCPTLNCPRVFRLASELRVHKRSHLGIHPYSCKVSDCNWTAIDQRQALRHVRLTHFGLPPTETQQRRIGIKDKRTAKEYVAFDHKQVENESEDDEKAIATPSHEPTVCPVVDCGRKLSHFNNVNLFRNHVNAHQGIRPFKCLWPGCLHSGTQKPNVIRHIGRKHLGIPYLQMDYSQVYDRAQGFVREGPRHACTSSTLCLSTRFTNSVARKRHERTHSSLARFHCSATQEGLPCEYRKNKWGKVFRHAREVHLKLTRKMTKGEARNENGSPQGSQFIKVLEDLLDYDSG